MQRIPFKWHILFWFGLIIVGTAALSPYYMNLFKATMHRLVFVPVWLIATYINLELLLPKLWDKGKMWSYSIILACLILVLTIVQRFICIQYIYPKYFWLREPTSDELNPFWIGPFIQFAAFIFLPVLLSIGVHIGWKWYQENYKSKQVIAEQQTAELNYLKAQINPHFLFNTLNNLYGLSLESSKKVPGMIIQLSELLSYSLYESKVEEVTIQKELQLVQNFIELEKERYSNRVEVNLSIADDVDLNTNIAPLLLLPLIENAFKHGVKNSIEVEPIDVKLRKEKKLFIFEIENRINTDTKLDQDENKGIGLKNLQRRLELHYPNKHTLTIKNDNNLFSVHLSIKTDG